MNWDGMIRCNGYDMLSKKIVSPHICFLVTVQVEVGCVAGQIWWRRGGGRSVNSVPDVSDQLRVLPVLASNREGITNR